MNTILKSLLYYFTLVAAFALIIFMIGCFDSQPPQGVTGQVVGCATSGDDLLCLTVFKDRGLPNDDTNLTVSGELSNYATRNSQITHVMISSFTGNTVVYVKLNRAENHSVVGKTKTYARIRLYDTPVIVLTGLTPKPGALNWADDDLTYTSPTGDDIFTGYMIANLTRPEIQFDPAPNVDDIKILQLPSGLIEDDN